MVIILMDTTEWEMRCRSKAVVEKETLSGQADDLSQRAQVAPGADYLPYGAVSDVPHSSLLITDD